MKTLYRFLTVAFLVSTFASCDLVPVPIPEPEIIEGVCIMPTVDSLMINRDYRKTYVEEFTGHKCITCPANTALLLQQLSENKDRMIVNAFHAGGFAVVDPPKYTTDFNTEYGTEVFQHFDMATQPIPSAIINRKAFPSYNDMMIFNNATTFWEGPIDEENTNTSTDFGLGLAANYSPESNIICVKVSTEILNNVDGDYRLLVLCVEDSVISAQLDARVSESEYPDKIVTDYTHRHVFRGKLNQDINFNGDPFVSGAVDAGTWVDYELNATMPSNVVTKENVLLVALIVDADSEEVVQSEEVHVHVL